MEKLLIEIESASKAKELSSVLSALNFVKKVTTVHSSKSMLEALQEIEVLKTSMVKRKNKAIEKYL